MSAKLQNKSNIDDGKHLKSKCKFLNEELMSLDGIKECVYKYKIIVINIFSL